MDESKLSDHKRKKGVFLTPFNSILGSKVELCSFSKERLPEYLWIALILNSFERQEAFSNLKSILDKLMYIDVDMGAPAFSKILNMDESSQEEFYQYIKDVIGNEILQPLSILFKYSEHPIFSKFFSDPSVLIESRKEILIELLQKCWNHQSNFSTDVRFFVVYFMGASGKLHLPKERIDDLNKYPYLTHSDKEMELIRASIRNFEMLLLNDYDNKNYLENFWGAISVMTECNLFCMKFDEENSNTKNYVDSLFTIMHYYTSYMLATNPLDDKLLVLLGLLNYSHKIILEMVEHNLYNSITARNSARILIENFIMIKYLNKKEVEKPDIWKAFQIYGLGAYKAIIARGRDFGLPESSHIDYQHIEMIVNEHTHERFINIDTNYFDNMKVREKAIYVGEEELWRFFYDYDSSFAHGLWGAVRESSLLPCNNPAHHFHCIPDYENQNRLKSVWDDCVMVMNKTITYLNDLYALPENLIKEVIKYENELSSGRNTKTPK